MTTANLVSENFYWRLLALTPTSTLAHAPQFTALDSTRLKPEQSAGTTRGFAVNWLGCDEEHQIDGTGVTDGGENRQAQHRFELEVYYSTKIKHRDLLQLILADRADITKLLRADANWVGYDDDNSTTDIGLWERIREADEIDTEEPTHWVLRQIWRCTINEDE